MHSFLPLAALCSSSALADDRHDALQGRGEHTEAPDRDHEEVEPERVPGEWGDGVVFGAALWGHALHVSRLELEAQGFEIDDAALVGGGFGFGLGITLGPWRALDVRIGMGGGAYSSGRARRVAVPAGGAHDLTGPLWILLDVGTGVVFGRGPLQVIVEPRMVFHGGFSGVVELGGAVSVRYNPWGCMSIEVRYGAGAVLGDRSGFGHGGSVLLGCDAGAPGQYDVAQ